MRNFCCAPWQRGIHGACILPVVPGPTREPSPSTPIDTARADAISDLDLLLEAAAVLRAGLRSFETALRKVRRHLARGGAAAELHDVLDIISAREDLTRVAAAFQAIRHTSRLSIFRVQAAEGMSVGAISRAWGLSRQLVSRMLKDAQPKEEGAS
jgi:hypothetical protein